jgi:hypothetical protein
MSGLLEGHEFVIVRLCTIYGFWYLAMTKIINVLRGPGAEWGRREKKLWETGR